MSNVIRPQSFISLDDAHAFRDGQAWRASLAMLGNALQNKNFDLQEADLAFEECQRLWEQKFGTKEGCFEIPWSDDFDVGQCANWAVKRDLSHPLIMACRWGTSQSLNWLCAKEGVGATVKFKGVADFWPPEMAAEHGLSGTLGTMLSMRGVSLEESLSSWLVGCSNAPKGAVGFLVEEARPWVEALENGLPLAPSTVFLSGLSSAICRDENDTSCTSEEAVRALCSLGPRVWIHESKMEGSDVWLSSQESQGCPLNFFEDAMGNDNAKAIRLLAECGFEMPRRERFDMLVLEWGMRSEGKTAAIDAMLFLYARIESAILNRESRVVGTADKAKRKFL